MIEAYAEFAPWLGVFETLRVVEGHPLFVPEHAAELRRAAEVLGFHPRLDLPAMKAQLTPNSGRWRWLATPRGVETFFSEEPEPSAEPLDLSVSTVRVGSQNWDARFKTVSYLSHVQALRIAATPEVVLMNEHRCVASAARANIFWRRGDRLYTPHPEAGCRGGVIRHFVRQRREVEQGHFPLEDLLAADEIFLTNSIRGIVSARSLEGRALENFSAADKLRAEYSAIIREQIERD
jgi:branched-subunit amino acid aminotransferase/4-amino-4-deoxychorismate lyase